MFKTIYAAAVTMLLLSVSVVHADDSCEKQAADKKLSGAAKMSFVAKCERKVGEGAASDAAASCAKEATDKKLAGAAKMSFIKKCTKDATSK
jgi:hypothetical protein